MPILYIIMFTDESVTLTVIADTYVRIQEPAYQNSGRVSVSVPVCATVQIDQPLDRLVAFNYHWTTSTTAKFTTHYYSNGYVDRPDFTLPVNRPFSIRPNTTGFNRECFNIGIYADDSVEPDELLVIIIQPVSPLDRVNFTANNTITIVIEDNPSK